MTAYIKAISTKFVLTIYNLYTLIVNLYLTFLVDRIDFHLLNFQNHRPTLTNNFQKLKFKMGGRKKYTKVHREDYIYY